MKAIIDSIVQKHYDELMEDVKEVFSNDHLRRARVTFKQPYGRHKVLSKFFLVSADPGSEILADFRAHLEMGHLFEVVGS